MKVVYQKPIAEKIEEANREAADMGKEIKEIRLSETDWKELGKFAAKRFLNPRVHICPLNFAPSVFMGVSIVKDNDA